MDKEIREAAKRAAEKIYPSAESVTSVTLAKILQEAYLAGALEFGAKWAEWARADERARVLRSCGRLYLTNAAWCDAAEKRRKLLE